MICFSGLLPRSSRRSLLFGPVTRASCASGADVPEGTYAASIGHDLNGKKRMDTNFIGVPIDQRGVSNLARPRRRAPRLDEAAFKVPVDARQIVSDIMVAK